MRDTHPAIEKMHLNMLRQAKPSKRFELACSLSKSTMELSRQAIYKANPNLSLSQLKFKILNLYYKDEALAILNDGRLDCGLLEEKKLNSSDLTLAIKPLLESLAQFSIDYYIGGSVASSAYGLARSTIDVDLVVGLKIQHIKKLVEALKDNYYLDEELLQEAISNKGSFNIIHVETLIKLDIFVLQNNSHDQTAFKRAKENDFLQVKEPVKLCSPEDIILYKLHWYRLGGEVSEKQWHDVLGVLKVQEKSLDLDYLLTWASDLKVDDLLKQVLQEAGIV